MRERILFDLRSNLELGDAAGTGCQAAVSEAETAAEDADADVNGDAYKQVNNAEQHAET